MSDLETVRALLLLAKEFGVSHLRVGGVEIRLQPVSCNVPAAVAPTTEIRPLSVSGANPDAAAERAAKRDRIAAYRDAVEAAHIFGYPNLEDYGLTVGDVS